jgi:hypothetical protein
LLHRKLTRLAAALRINDIEAALILIAPVNPDQPEKFTLLLRSGKNLRARQDEKIHRAKSEKSMQRSICHLLVFLIFL